MSEASDSDARPEDFATEVSIDKLDCIGDTIRQRLKSKGVETRMDLHKYRRRVCGLWWDCVDGVGEYTANQIEDEFQERAFGDE